MTLPTNSVASITAHAGAPSTTAGPLDGASEFVRSTGLVVDEAGTDRVLGHIDLDDRHHTPWGIVHGGVYATAVESAASIGASAAVQERGLVAVGLTNTTHFLRSLTSGRVIVEAVALNQGRTQQLWKVDITDSEGRLVAHGELRLQNLDPFAPLGTGGDRLSRSARSAGRLPSGGVGHIHPGDSEVDAECHETFPGGVRCT